MFERATSDESIPDEGGIAHEHGGSIEGPAIVGGNGSSSNLLEEEMGVIAASVPVAVGSLEPAQSEGEIDKKWSTTDLSRENSSTRSVLPYNRIREPPVYQYSSVVGHM